LFRKKTLKTTQTTETQNINSLELQTISDINSLQRKTTPDINLPERKTITDINSLKRKTITDINLLKRKTIADILSETDERKDGNVVCHTDDGKNPEMGAEVFNVSEINNFRRLI